MIDMQIHHQNAAVKISGFSELTAANAQSFRTLFRTILREGVKTVEIDFSETERIDSCGLGALVSLFKQAQQSTDEVTIRLLNPAPPVQQVFELTRMHHLFEIVPQTQYCAGMAHGTVLAS